MKKNKKIVKKKEDRVEDIVPFWSMLSGWDELPFDKKAEHYWKYTYVGGVRKIVTDKDYE
jgi:hypothetical protein